MKVLVAVDGSEPSKHLGPALAAFSPDNQIILLHVIHVPQLAYPGTGMTVGHQFLLQAEEAMRAEGTQILDEWISKVPSEVGKIDKRIKVGPPAEVILALAEEEKVNLVLIGSRGLGVIREQALGSVSHRVASHSPCSTMVVRSSLKHINHILLPLEGREDAEQAMDFLSHKPFPNKVHISLLHIIPFMQPVLPIGMLIPDSVKKDLFAGTEKFLKEQAARVGLLGYPVSSTVITGVPSQIIHEQAKSVNADLIMMGVQRGRTLPRFLLGSVSHSILHHSTCSVLLLK